ncbi:hypothetical protein [Phycicoccus sp. Root101]|uniref:hypothetical protein n=1 Tax=Phycicoccus sp. Root101 TaxID=1736421 RepID=UPI0007034536|nr:hypothetical protein [Phycicoccus sp. Root101]KQU68304.1 hypothetical protein ASC58_12205 [Phycicoccus sp. Root101]
MKVRSFEIEATPQELDSSTTLNELLRRMAGQSVRDGAGVAAEDAGSDDAAADLAATAPVTPARQDTIPGVDTEGQDAIRSLLDRNPAGDLFVQFLSETNGWQNVKTLGIKSKGHLLGTPLDYSRYLRLRKTGSQFGGFAYVYAQDGLINLRLAFTSDEELAAIAPDAWRLAVGHREYRVNIRITNESTLGQALRLARQAYDLT